MWGNPQPPQTYPRPRNPMSSCPRSHQSPVPTQDRVGGPGDGGACPVGQAAVASEIPAQAEPTLAQNRFVTGGPWLPHHTTPWPGQRPPVTRVPARPIRPGGASSCGFACAFCQSPNLGVQGGRQPNRPAACGKRDASAVPLTARPYQLVKEPSRRRRWGASLKAKLCLATRASLTSTPRPGVSGTI